MTYVVVRPKLLLPQDGGVVSRLCDRPRYVNAMTRPCQPNPVAELTTLALPALHILLAAVQQVW